LKARGLDGINLGRLLRRENLLHPATRARPPLASFRRFDRKKINAIIDSLSNQDAVEIEASDCKVRSMLALSISTEVGWRILSLEAGLVKCR